MRNKARDVFFSLSLELIDLWPNAVARVQTRIGRLPTDGLPLLLCRLFFIFFFFLTEKFDRGKIDCA